MGRFNGHVGTCVILPVLFVITVAGCNQRVPKTSAPYSAAPVATQPTFTSGATQTPVSGVAPAPTTPTPAPQVTPTEGSTPAADPVVDTKQNPVVDVTPQGYLVVPAKTEQTNVGTAVADTINSINNLVTSIIDSATGKTIHFETAQRIPFCQKNKGMGDGCQWRCIPDDKSILCAKEDWRVESTRCIATATMQGALCSGN